MILCLPIYAWYFQYEYYVREFHCWHSRKLVIDDSFFCNTKLEESFIWIRMSRVDEKYLTSAKLWKHQDSRNSSILHYTDWTLDTQIRLYIDEEIFFHLRVEWGSTDDSSMSRPKDHVLKDFTAMFDILKHILILKFSNYKIITKSISRMKVFESCLLCRDRCLKYVFS